MQISLPAPAAPFSKPVKPDTPIAEAARAFEAVFISEMLKSAGLGQPIQGFGGGVGEEQFASLLVQKQAEQIVQSGGLGVSEMIFAALSEIEK